MKKLISIILLLAVGVIQAQNNIGQLLNSGIEDAKTFTEDYLMPATDGVVNALSNGWYNTAEGKSWGKFEISIIGNASFIQDENKSFTLNVDDYENLRFQNPSQTMGTVATVFGENNPDVVMVVEYQDEFGMTQELDITLPQGLGTAGVDIIPSAYLQASVGVLPGTEIKGRFIPKVDVDQGYGQLYGAAIQHEVTNWLPLAENFPIHISALVGYTNLQGGYDLDEASDIEGENQRVETEVDSWLFTAILSTKLPVINFYGGLGYYTGKSTTDLLGTYEIQTGLVSTATVTDPFSVTQEASGMKATIGAKLKLAFFRLHADYSFQQYNNFSVGLNFGI
ncbi:DUF6588 family protein [Mesonia sp. K7]|uniref:DUF6588 family protein n=1 Tax=Mesonia sp. K7 TaxID=2218606 RepID=UPI000DA8B16B|nr:DUF6588 family protein [Mesonia sp. K7]PZD77594.1 hypothetical protein DNG35_08410 [Mesonia sp. K7]